MSVWGTTLSCRRQLNATTISCRRQFVAWCYRVDVNLWHDVIVSTSACRTTLSWYDRKNRIGIIVSLCAQSWSCVQLWRNVLSIIYMQCCGCCGDKHCGWFWSYIYINFLIANNFVQTKLISQAMPLTDNQVTDFFRDIGQMGLSACTCIHLQGEGILIPDNLIDFTSKDSWEQILETASVLPWFRILPTLGNSLRRTPSSYPQNHWCASRWLQRPWSIIPKRIVRWRRQV